MLISNSRLTRYREYYFSVDNLCKDVFLRKNMDSQGFVLLSFIANFNRVKQLTTDIELIKHVCHHSSNIEYKIGNDGQDRLRKATDWENWVLPLKSREEEAQNDGPTELHHPPVPHPQGMEFQYMTRPPPMSPNGVPPSPGMMANGASFRPMNGHGMNGFDPNGMGQPFSMDGQGPGNPPDESFKSPIHDPADPDAKEADGFVDEQMKHLTVVVRNPEMTSSQTDPSHEASRNLPNGSINGENVSEELSKLKLDSQRGNTQANDPLRSSE
jgi:la-related protein 1